MTSQSKYSIGDNELIDTSFDASVEVALWKHCGETECLLMMSKWTISYNVSKLFKNSVNLSAMLSF